MDSRVKRSLRPAEAGEAPRRAPLFEMLEVRQYLYTPDLYIPIAGGGCMCPACTGSLTPEDTVSLSASGAQAAAEAAPAITGLIVYNADTNQPIGPIGDTSTLDMATLPPNISLAATTAGSVGSVRFAVDGNPNVQTENYAPYFIHGENTAGMPNAWRPSNGTHTMQVTAFSGKDATGASSAVSLSFNIRNSSDTGPSVVSGPTVTFTDNSADAKEAGIDKGTWVVSRTGSTSSALTVTYSVAGSATNGTDYQTLSGTITIPAGNSSVNFVVTPKDDTLAEGTEDVVVTLTGGLSYNVGSTPTATCPIFDNDSVGNPGTGQNISDITWTSSGVKRSPEPRTEGGSIQIGSKIYAIGGFTATGGTGSFFPLTRRVDVYDMATKTWKQLASIPSAAAANHFGVATDGANIYTVAGQTGHTYGIGTNTVYKYNIASNTWSKFYANLPEVRFGGGSFIANGWLHYVGGDKADRETPTTDHWAINLNAPGSNWVRKASMPLPGDHMSHATINGKVYFFGGEHGHHGLSAGDENGYIQHNYTFEYNPANDTWTRKANMPLALSHIEGSTLAINGKAVLIGGLLTGGGQNTTSRVHVYDPASNTWKTLATRYPKRIIGSESGYLNGKIYMTDGYSPDSNDRQAGFEGTVKFV